MSDLCCGLWELPADLARSRESLLEGMRKDLAYDIGGSEDAAGGFFMTISEEGKAGRETKERVLKEAGWTKAMRFPGQHGKRDYAVNLWVFPFRLRKGKFTKARI